MGGKGGTAVLPNGSSPQRQFSPTAVLPNGSSPP